MPDPNETEKKAIALAKRGKVMTLATTLDHEPWIAPVYYVLIRPDFYFFSSPSSRHIQEALASGRASAAIFEDGEKLHDIRGLQMTGTIAVVDSATHAVSVITRYIKKFEVVRLLIKKDAPVGLDFFKSAFNARLYRFTPQRGFYVDNQAGFGKRVKIDI